jgi:hypothetical protein
MARESVTSDRPLFASIIRTSSPYLLFTSNANADYTVEFRYLSRNKGTNYLGTAEVLNISDTTEIPLFNEEYHYLVMLRAGMIVAGEMASLVKRDGTPRYPGMANAYLYFEKEYNRQFAIDREKARRRKLGRFPLTFALAGAEYAIISGSRNL